MHPFDNPAYSARPGDRFILTRPESSATRRYLVEITDRRFSRGDANGNSADDIELRYLGYCDAQGRLTGAMGFELTSRVPHGAVLRAGYEVVPALQVAA